MRSAFLLVLSSSAAVANPLLAPVEGDKPTEWKRQLRSAPTYHGTFTLKTRSVAGASSSTTTGTIASDPAHRMMHVHTKTRFVEGKDSYEREVDLVVDGSRARLVGKSKESSHTSTGALPTKFAPEAPFGDISSSDAGFTYAGDLRQTVLDCLDQGLEVSGLRVKPDFDAAFKRVVSRRDSSLTGLSGNNGRARDECVGAELIAGKDGTLRGIHWHRPNGEFIVELDFDLIAGASAAEFSIANDSLVGATKLDPALDKVRGYVDAIVADPKRLAAIRAAMK